MSVITDNDWACCMYVPMKVTKLLNVNQLENLHLVVLQLSILCVLWTCLITLSIEDSYTDS